MVTTGGLDLPTWFSFARLSGKIPRIAIVGGYCFAGNAAIAGCADIIIATEDSSLGMGGPAMIEGGGLGQFHPKEVGPANELSTKGVIDILVKDEAEAVQVAKKYLSYFQGEKKKWTAKEQSDIYSILPEDRRYAYDIKKSSPPYPMKTVFWNCEVILPKTWSLLSFVLQENPWA